MDGISEFHVFLQSHQRQLESSAVPKIYWEALWKKLKNQIFDAGSVFQLAKIDYEDGGREAKDPVWKLFVSAENGLFPEDKNNIYLIDHAWTYDVTEARRNLSEVPGLLDRMCNLMGFDANDDTSFLEETTELVLREMWRYNQSFSLSAGSIEERMPVWYVMDELGSAINHSDEPNFRTVPFLHLSEGTTYTLLFPIERVECEEEVTRDFVEGQTNDENKRRALLLPWIDDDFSNDDFVQSEPDDSYFLAGRVSETLPRDEKISEARSESTFNVYSEYKYVNDYLTDSRFTIVESPEQADILWLMGHFKDYENLSRNERHVFVNQFPFENVLTIKDLLAIVCRRKAPADTKYDGKTLKTYPSWLPTTYNLSTELRQFVAYFQRREALGLDNHWICKPWNLARGLDTHVTKNLNHILRLPSTGPKIAQKYIESPVLYLRPDVGPVKFDIRYVVLLKSTKPLVAYAYSNFFLRFANREFALDNLDVYEQHFTVMNYSESSELCHVKCHDFIERWNNMYRDHDWRKNVEPMILDMLREVLEAAVQAEPPKGIADSPCSRAVYAADLMLGWNNDRIQPFILEVNFSPDNKRACEYYPEFYNDIFKCLFLDHTDPDVFHELVPIQ